MSIDYIINYYFNINYIIAKYIYMTVMYIILKEIFLRIHKYCKMAFKKWSND